MRLIVTFFTILFWCSSIHAQRASEEEIAIEALFIAANQNKIIGKYEEATKIYLKLLEKDPVNAAVLHDLARVYHSLDNLNDAVKAAKKAVRYAPDNNWFKLTLAQFQLENLEYGAAAKSFGDIAVKTGDKDLYRRWAQTLIEGQNYPSAIVVMNKMDRQFGKEESRSDEKIELFLAMNDKKSAIVELKSWIASDPNDTYYLIKLGKFYTVTYEKKKAINTFQDVLEQDPKNGDAMLALQELKGGKGSDKNDKIKSLIYSPTISNDIKVKALIPVLTSGNIGEVSKILPFTEYLATANVDHPQSQALHADALYLTEDLSGAKDFYIRTLALDKSNYQVWDQLLSVYNELGDLKGLSNLADEALDYFPNQGSPYYFLAKAAFEQNEISEAKKMLAEAKIVGGSNVLFQSKFWTLNAQILDAEGDTNGALSYLESFDSKDPGLAELIGDFYIKIGEKTKASEAFSKAIKQGGHQQRLKQKIESI
ncbi:MAG: tetratricopeptide (TPR) repeat protein [Saprospiraceae bacterium]|jgi:tetratricopeptide (TPR) repeat protein